MKKILLFYLFSYLFCIGVFSQPDPKNILKSINDEEYTMLQKDSNCIHYDFINFSQLELDIIPMLIDSINSKNTYPCIYCLDQIAPISSYIPSVYVGEAAAKYIERIINPYFRFNRITKNGLFHSLTLEDMKLIKELYLKWWEENKQYSKKEIKKRRKHQGALDGTIYSWDTCPKIEGK